MSLYVVKIAGDRFLPHGAPYLTRRGANRMAHQLAWFLPEDKHVTISRKGCVLTEIKGSRMLLGAV